MKWPPSIPVAGTQGDVEFAGERAFGVHRRGPAGLRRLFGFGRNSRAFTLIELMISSALMAIILVAAYACFSACIASQKIIEPRLEVVQNARVALALISADLRCACSLSKNYDFLGVHRVAGELEADSMDFATHNYTPSRPREGDYCQESLYLDKDAESGQYCLYRRRNPTIAFDPLSGGSREEIARGLRGVRFEYYDGYDWFDDWGEQDQRRQQTSMKVQSNLSGLPEAVRITLWFDADPKAKPAETKEDDHREAPLVFQTIARLNLASLSQSSSSSGGSTNSPPTATAPGGGS